MSRHTGGWIKIHRSIISTDPSNIFHGRGHDFMVFTRLILMANHTDSSCLLKRQKIKLKRGQIVTSQKEIAHNLGTTRGKVRKSLEFLILTKQITIETTNTGTTGGSLITIPDYNKSQCVKSDQQPKEQPKEQPKGEPRFSHGSATVEPHNEEDKNDKKITPHISDLKLYNAWKEWAITVSTTTNPNEASWCDAFRKLREIEKIPPDKIASILNFVKTDSFWSKNAVSPVPLRKRMPNGKLKIENIMDAMPQSNTKQEWRQL